jgi:hypothetical protein
MGVRYGNFSNDLRPPLGLGHVATVWPVTRPRRFGRPGGPPDLIEAAEALGVTGAELEAALGPPPPDIAGAAATVGVDVEFLRELIGGP